MNSKDLIMAVKRLAAYYERPKAPSAESTDLWLDKVKFIPTEAVDWIMDRIMDQNETWPRNLPATMRACFEEWLFAHPEKRAYKTGSFNHCPDCNDGLFRVQKMKNGYTYDYTFACARCGQGDYRAYPREFKHLLVMKGYEDITPKATKGRVIPMNTTPEALASSAVKNMPAAKIYEGFTFTGGRD